ncbi:MAG: S9 family peptidase [Polyangiaceae bacterium]|nr:S9 family peptidase [Polyangiaceae bacterium]
MLDVRAPSPGIVSNDGKRLYFTWTITGTQQIFRLDGPNQFPMQLTGGEDATSIAAVLPDGKWLVVQRDRSGEENPGLYLLSTDGGALQVIQHKPKVQTMLDLVTPDGKYLYYRANDINAESYALYRYDVAAKKTETLFTEAGIFSTADVKTEQSTTKLLVRKSVGGNMNEFYELDLSTKKLTPLFGQGEREDYNAEYGVPGEIIVHTPKIGEYRRLYVFKDNKLTPISPELKFDVAGFSVDEKKKRILYTVNEGGYTKAFGLDAKTKKPIQLPKLPEGDHTNAGATSPNGRYTSFSVDSGTSPLQSFVYDWESSKLEKWHKPATPELDTTKFARASLESYPARDGTKIPMFVRRPAGCDKRTAAEGPCPVIVAFHGGPEGQTVAGFNTRAQLFVDAGFVYAEPNVRGSDGYGKTWLHADDGAKRLAIITDIEDASKFVRANWAVGGKPPKIGVYGGSYGGYSVLIAQTMFAGAYDAGVSVVGISSLLTFLENTAPYRRILRISEYGDPQKDREALVALSPTTHIDKLKAPLMILQGATDPRVPAGEALQFHEALQKKNVPSELMIFADEGHGFRKRSNQVLAFGHTIRFFEKYLK